MDNNKFSAIINTFSTSQQDLMDIAAAVRYDIEEGLKGNTSSLKMLKSYIGLPSGQEEGKYLALDFGGTNLRVVLIELHKNGKFTILKKVAKPLKVAGNYDFVGKGSCAKDMFDFITEIIDEVIEGNKNEEYFLGHTFSFPSSQTNIYNAKLITWTKEFATSGVEGQVVNDLLKESLSRYGFNNVKPIAVINDTVAVLLAAAYKSSDTYIGSIYATGHNTCYFESYPESNSQPMIINLEIGNFYKLAVNKYDTILNNNSELPDHQRLEKMVSGRYIGELFSYCLQDGLQLEKLPDFTSIDLSTILNDNSTTLNDVKTLITNHLSIELSTENARLIQTLAQNIVSRSARIVAATYCGILWHIFPNNIPRHNIVIDGSLFEKMPTVTDNMHEALHQVLGSDSAGINLVLENGGSILGAALAAAMSK
ncbi:hexokinase family protein [Pectinatus sottacetonis]|uniref:hexokinase n=1 Tax=Pectinatus sottacetonis TaxID=1002795 RepID=UPI0018C4A026|nr:hexokinase [Pectinatus sottacetonis]